jgi:glutaredoxin-related protein
MKHPTSILTNLQDIINDLDWRITQIETDIEAIKSYLDIRDHRSLLDTKKGEYILKDYQKTC